MKAGIFKPLSIRGYRSLFGAQVFSDLGNWLDFIAIQIIVAYHWGLDETAVAFVIIVIGIPWIIIGPFASVFVDRFSKKKIMVYSLLLKTIFVIGLYFSPNLVILLIFIFLKGTVSALYDPARQSSIRLHVPEHLLPEAVTLSQLSVNTMKILGPALGGGLIAIFGVKSPFLFEIIGTLLAVAFLLMMPNSLTSQTIQSDEQEKMDKPSFWMELIAGFKHINYAKLLRLSIILSSIAFFIIFLYDGLFIFIAKDLGFTEGNFGVLVSAVGFGSVIGSLLLGQWTNWRVKPIHFMLGSSFFSGLFIIMIGLGSSGVIHVSLFVWVVGAFFLGVLAAGESVPYGYVLQSETPKEMMGRVSSAASALQTLSMLIAPAVGAILAKTFSVSSVLLAAGLTTCFVSIVVLTALAKNRKSANTVKETTIEL